MTGVVEGEATFLEQLQAFEGRQVGPTSRAPEPVNTAMIRHWVEAVGDENPVYLDPDAAKASVHGELIAPPVMLQAWTMQGLRGKRSAGSAQDELMELLDSAGFTSVVATNCEQEYFRDLHPGDHLSVTSTIESVSPEKDTALGTGHFVTTRQTYTDDAGEVVATMLFRILKFAPKKADATTPPPRPRPAITRDNAFWWEGVKAGKLLIQRCGGCGTLRHPPRPMCPRCQGLEWDTVESSGRGTVYSFVVSHHPQVPAFDYPLAIGLIELEEGTRLVSNVVDVDPADVHVGMPVEVLFEAFDDELTLPQFRPRAADHRRTGDEV
jgi:3-oxo-4,17-pregnadiene-20-carboxyl-CoA hydratase alpha subunit